MNIAFLGCVVSPDELDKMSGASVAGNKMQWNILKYMQNISKIHSISHIPLASFPRDKTIIVRDRHVITPEGVKLKGVGYINIPVLKQVIQVTRMYYFARKCILKNDIQTVLCYNAFFHVGIPLRMIKKRFPNIKAICLLADPPLADDNTRRGLYRLISQKMLEISKKTMQLFDAFIVLNENLGKQYCNGKPYIVVDGGIDDKEFADLCEKDSVKEDKKNLVYCGSLTEYNGIIRLVEAMNYVQNKDIVLEIYGGGYLDKEIKKYQKNNIRIKGKVSNDEILKIQQSAWAIIAPRIIHDPITAMSFPSKTFEMLSSRTPVIATHLECYDSDYNGTMFFIEDDSVEGIARAINTFDEIPEAEKKIIVENAINMIKNKKTWSRQVKRIETFIERQTIKSQNSN